jgi:Ser/Thr protein kinase RdoA (MazF antagonist)
MTAPRREIERLLKSYDLGNLKSAKLLYDKWNVIYLVTTTRGKYVLKIRRFSEEKLFRHEATVASILGDDVPHSKPLPTKRGGFFVRFNGNLAYFMNYLRGAPARDGTRVSLETLRDMGRTIALLHRTRSAKTPGWSTCPDFRKTFSKLPEGRERSLGMRTLELLEKEGFYGKRLPRGFTHGDPMSQNMLLRAGKVVGVIDYEMAHREAYVCDIGINAISTCFDGERLSKKRLTTLIAGYESIRKLTALERRHIPNSLLHAGLWVFQGGVIKHPKDTSRIYEDIRVRRYLRILQSCGI